ncbi:transposase, partial [uncultured Pseudoteredinibacter sp.]
MGQTKKRNYDRYTLAFKLQAVKLANHPDVMSKDVASSLDIHPVMLYRWQMEHRRGELKENKNMKPSKPSPKRRPDRTDPVQEVEDKLSAAEKRIKQL